MQDFKNKFDTEIFTKLKLGECIEYYTNTDEFKGLIDKIKGEI